MAKANLLMTTQDTNEDYGGFQLGDRANLKICHNFINGKVEAPARKLCVGEPWKKLG
jgi:hypothetical protein